MGSRITILLQEDEVVSIQNETGFSRRQIIRLWHRFNQLDKEAKGYLNREDFMRIPELAINPLADQLIRSFFDDVSLAGDDGHVNFRQFIHTLAIFRLRKKSERSTIMTNTKDKKLKFAFNMYDSDRDGYINQDELVQVLHQLVGEHINADQLLQIAERTITEADTDHDSRISFPEFCKSLEKVDIEEKMSIRFLS